MLKRGIISPNKSYLLSVVCAMVTCGRFIRRNKKHTMIDETIVATEEEVIATPEETVTPEVTEETTEEAPETPAAE